MRRLLFAVLLYSYLSHSSCASHSSYGDAIDAIARAAVTQKAVPGLAIGVMHHGQVVFARGYGLADLENDVAVRADSVFPIASVTKNFTAAAVLKLADRGLLSLDDDIGKFLPDFPHRGKGVTVRRLLNHTAGVHSMTAIPAYWAQIGEAVEPAKLIAIFRDAPLDFEPGSSYQYSNSGYVLLGAIIEKVSGMPYPDYLQKQLFAPLGLTGTHYCGTAELVPRRVRGYAKTEAAAFVNARHVDMSQGYAAGGVCSTVGDLLQWQHALHHGKVLQPETYAAMTTPAEGRTYGLGIGTAVQEGHRMLFHAGGIHGFDAMATAYPADELEIVVLANAGGETAAEIEAKVAALMLQAVSR
jgi:CubicO group peptidase (beta-lactamase class C family)